MAYTYLVSTLIMGVLLALVVSVVAQSNARSRWLPARSAVTDLRGGAGPGSASATGGASGLTVIAAVLGVVLLAVGVSADIGGNVDGVVLFVGALAGMIAVFASWGCYHIARSRGLQFAAAVAVGVWSLGTLLLLAVVLKLLLA
ncbi:MAG: hypothetical protein ABEJ74_05220 [Haloferacaceae archaeon]